MMATQKPWSVIKGIASKFADHGQYGQNQRNDENRSGRR